MEPHRINIHETTQYLEGVPHAKYTALRQEDPVSFQGEPGGPGYWAVMKHQDVVYVSKRPKIFSSARGGINIPDAAEEDLDIARMIMINMDPPQHAKYRKLVSTGFTPRMTKRLEGAIQNAVNAILDHVRGKDEVDFVASIASQLPLYLIADLIGWPEEDRALMFDWSDRVARIDFDPDDARIAAMEFFGYCQDFLERLNNEDSNQDKPDDLVHTLMAAEVDGEQLNDMEIINFLLLLAIGGNETTRNCISGGFLALHDNPEMLRALRENPELMDRAVEEMLRWTSPIIAFRRTAQEDTELGGQLIREGDKVVLYYASANRDEAVFDNPHCFDIYRDKNQHLAFGVGQHFCLGSTLARMEIGILFKELLRRFPEMHPTGEVTRLESNYVNGTVSFGVKVGPESA